MAKTKKWKKFALIVVAVPVAALGCYYLRGLMMLGYVDSAIGRVRAISEAETLARQLGNGAGVARLRMRSRELSSVKQCANCSWRQAIGGNYRTGDRSGAR